MSATCDDFELMLLEGPRTPEVEAHLAGCERCRAFARDAERVVELARLPEPTAAERAKLAGLAPAALADLRARSRRRGLLRQGLGRAVAAGLGALVATTALPRGSAPSGHVPAAASAGDVPLMDFPLLPDDVPVASADDVDLEMPWPNPDEGVAP